METQQLTSTRVHRARFAIKWRSRKGIAAVVLFLLISVVFEILLIFAFQAMGLVDTNAWITILQIPGTDWTFTLSVSLIFHFLPLSVVLVLLASWTYLTKSGAFIPKPETTKRVSPPPRRTQEGGRLKSAKRLWRSLGRRFQRFGRSVKSGFRKIPGVSASSRRLSHAQAIVRSTLMILLIFGSVALGLFLIEYPDFIHKATLNLYRGSPGLIDLVFGIGQWLHGVGQAIPPLGDLGAAINNALINAAPGFRSSLQGAGNAITEPIFALDTVSKYTLSQNLAAWSAAIIALLYGSYGSMHYRRRLRRG